MHPLISGIGVIYPDTSFVDSRDMDEINPILQKFPDTVDGPALPYTTVVYNFPSSSGPELPQVFW